MNIFRVLQSVFAAIFGVQSRKNAEQDFTHGRIQHYAITGIIIVVLIILLLRWLVLYVVL